MTYIVHQKGNKPLFKELVDIIQFNFSLWFFNEKFIIRTQFYRGVYGFEYRKAQAGQKVQS